MNFIANKIIKRNFTSFAKNNKLKSFEWKRVGSIDLKLDSQNKNVKNKKIKTKKREIKNIRFSDYDYYSI